MSYRTEDHHTSGALSDISLDEIGHPKGTLAVLIIYLLLFILGWAALYVGAFLPRGTPDATPDQTALEQPVGTP